MPITHTYCYQCSMNSRCAECRICYGCDHTVGMFCDCWGTGEDSPTIPLGEEIAWPEDDNDDPLDGGEEDDMLPEPYYGAGGITP